MNAGERIKTLREEAGLSMSDLALIIGMDKSAISRWESGSTKNLTSKPLLKMAEYFNVSVDFVMGISDERTDKKTILLHIFNRLNEENKMQAVAYLKELEVRQDEATKSKGNG